MRRNEHQPPAPTPAGVEHDRTETTTLTMRDIAPKVLANDDMPCGAVPSVELLLDLRGDVLLDVVLLERGGRDIDRLLLHLLAHVDVLDHRLRASCACPCRVRRRVGRR